MNWWRLFHWPKYKVGDWVYIAEAEDVFLEITDINLEHLIDIRWQDCIAEGVRYIKGPNQYESDIISEFKGLWDGIYTDTEYSWDKEPFVWVYEFKLIKKHF